MPGYPRPAARVALARPPCRRRPRSVRPPPPRPCIPTNQFCQAHGGNGRPCIWPTTCSQWTARQYHNSNFDRSINHQPFKCKSNRGQASNNAAMLGSRQDTQRCPVALGRGAHGTAAVAAAAAAVVPVTLSLRIPLVTLRVTPVHNGIEHSSHTVCSHNPTIMFLDQNVTNPRPATAVWDR